VLGTFEDFPHGSGERIVAGGLNRNTGADQIVRQGTGIAFKERTQGAIGELEGYPAGERVGGKGGRELAIEGLGDDASQPGRDIDIAFVAQAIETGAQLGFDAALDVLVPLHYMT